MASSAQGPAPALRSEFLLRMGAEFEAPLMLGETPLGTRRILTFKSGSFAGPRLKGEIVPGGGDWVLVGRDGAARLDIRLTLRTEDGGLIYARSRGIFDAAPGVRERILAGEDVDPSAYYFRTLLEFETGAEPYRWLNRLVAAGVGRRTPAGMETDVFALV
jgi:hypothetical protein